MAAVTVAGCGDSGSDAGDTGDTDSTASESASPPGPPTPRTTWQPEQPERRVEAGRVEAEYAPVLDDVIAGLADVGQSEGWSHRARLSTERFSGICAVTVERDATGGPPPDVDALQRSLATAVAAHGFPDLTLENDPGGALTFVAHDGNDALFEYRSKSETTLAVRVATLDSDCD
jgi:hypothetical protein